MATANPTGGIDRRGAVLGLAIAAAVITILLNGVAYWLSYEALHDLATGHHMAGARAWAWPATLDAFVIIGDILILRASLLGRLDWFAMTLVGIGSAGSIILNVVSVGSGVDPVSKVVAAVPPVAGTIAFSALMRQIYGALAGPAAPSPRPGRRRRRLAARRQAVTAVLTPVTQPLPVAPPRPTTPPALPAAYSDARCEAIRRLYDSGHRPRTKTMLAAIAAAGLPVPSESWVRGTLRAEVEQLEPHLAALPAEPTPVRVA